MSVRVASHAVRAGSPGVRALSPFVRTVLIAAILAVSAAMPARTQTQAAPSRLISLVPAVTEIVFALGAGNSVVGVSSFDRYPPEVRALPRVGALVDPDFERILSLKPDLVFVYGTQSDLIARLERARVPIFRYEHAGLADVTTTIRAIGDRIQKSDAAKALATRIDRDLDEVRKRVAGRPRPRTAIVFEREPGTLRGIFASAGIGFMHDLLDVAGGADVFGDIKRQSVQASAELMLARSPEVIIEVYGEAQWSKDRLAGELKVWAGLPGIPAVRNNRVHILVDDRLAVPGPRVAEAARLLANLIHPGASEGDLTRRHGDPRRRGASLFSGIAGN